MKYMIVISLVGILVLTSCDEMPVESFSSVCIGNPENEYPVNHGEPSLCTDSICTKYLNIWKELTQEKNSLTDSFINTHIDLHGTRINSWNSGLSYRVCYYFQVDWAITYNCDQFIINIDPSNTYYPHLDLPRGEYLSKEKIKIALEGKAFSSKVDAINSISKVQPMSIDDALSEMVASTGVDNLCFIRMTLNRDTGNLTLEAGAQFTEEENLCIFAKMDLITGEITSQNGPCFI